MKKADIKIDFETKTKNKKNEDEEKKVLSTLNQKIAFRVPLQNLKCIRGKTQFDNQFIRNLTDIN